MDIYAKKIMGFLKSNMNLDLEIPDIAFHLKLDEQFVQNYMSSLLRQGLVTSKRNEYGRIYWYAIVPIDSTLADKSTIEIDAVEEFEIAQGAQIVKADKNINISDTEPEELTKKKIGFPFGVIVSVVMMLIIAIAGGKILSKQLENKFQRDVALSNKNFVSLKEFTTGKDELNSKVIQLQFEIKKLNSVIDSLKDTLVKAEAARVEELKSKPVVLKRPLPPKKKKK